MMLEIEPIPPFDFELTTLILKNRENLLIKFKDGVLNRLLYVNGKKVLVKMSSTGSTENPKILVDSVSENDLSKEDTKGINATVISMLNLNANLLPFYEAVKNDKVLSEITKNLWGLRSPTTPTVFEALIESIIEQQISLKVAHKLESSIIRMFGESIEADDEIYYSFPLPKCLSEASIKQLRECRLSQRKSEYVIDISKLITVEQLDLEKYKAYDNTGILIDELDQIRGVGRWTAEMTVLKGLHRFDAFPADDVGLRRHIAKHYTDDDMITSEEARDIAEGWGDWKGLAAFYLIVSDLL